MRLGDIHGGVARIALYLHIIQLSRAIPVHLNGESLLVVKNGDTPALVEFFAPWCPHCQHYKPEYAKIAERLEEASVSVIVADVDCTEYKAVCVRNLVNSYPSVKAFNFPGVEHGLTLESRKEDDVIEWVTDKLTNSTASETEGTTTALKQLRGGEESNLAENEEIRQGEGKAEAAKSKLAAIRVRSRAAERNLTALLRVRDAASAVLFAFSLDAFDFEGESAETALSGRRKKGSALLATLEMFYSGFPETSARNAFFNLDQKLFDGPNAADLIDAARWRDALLGWTMGGYADGDYPACGDSEATSEAANYACGLWSLLHLLAQNAPRHGFGGVRLRYGIRDFIAEFFGCSPCRDHFTAAFDTCGKLELEGAYLRLDRCKIAEEDDEAFALWLWDLHNAVSCRIYNGAGGDFAFEDSGRKLQHGRRLLFLSEASGSFPRYLWPDNSACSQCWEYLGNGQWRANERWIARFLENAFGIPTDFDLRNARGALQILQFNRSELWILAVLCFVLVAVAMSTRGLHRKLKSSSEEGRNREDAPLSMSASSQDKGSTVIRRKNGGHRGTYSPV